jgi:ribosomal protein L7Ae-like RNA K-turn-binding protein
MSKSKLQINSEIRVYKKKNTYGSIKSEEVALLPLWKRLKINFCDPVSKNACFEKLKNFLDDVNIKVDKQIVVGFNSVCKSIEQHLKNDNRKVIAVCIAKEKGNSTLVDHLTEQVWRQSIPTIIFINSSTELNNIFSLKSVSCFCLLADRNKERIDENSSTKNTDTDVKEAKWDDLKEYFLSIAHKFDGELMKTIV